MYLVGGLGIALVVVTAALVITEGRLDDAREDLAAAEVASGTAIAANGKQADAKSILAVLALGAGTGDVANVTAVGADAEQALAEITEIMTATEEEL